jgi:hypothetical protein
MRQDDDDDTQIYQRSWVGFTEQEVDDFHYWKDCTWSTTELVRYVEAQLKAKNA